MSKCTHPACSAEITWAVNLKTLKRVPLVPFDPNYPKAVRYDLSEPRSDGQRECSRNDQGEWMSHFADCPGANKFGKGKR
jgi:hypothetical protein